MRNGESIENARFFRIDLYYSFQVCRDETNEINDGGNILLSALI